MNYNYNLLNISYFVYYIINYTKVRILHLLYFFYVENKRKILTVPLIEFKSIFYYQIIYIRILLQFKNPDL